MKDLTATLLFLLLAAAGLSAAQLPRVAIAASADPSAASAHFTDPQTRLLASGRFAAVDLVEVMAATPTSGSCRRMTPSSPGAITATSTATPSAT